MAETHTQYLRLGFGSDALENRNWERLDAKALDLARQIIADIPAGGDLIGFYPDPLIRNEAVTQEKIADGAVTFPKLASNSVGVLALIDGAVDRAKLASNVWPNPVPTAGDVGKILTVAAGPTLVWGAAGGGGGDTLWSEDTTAQMLSPIPANTGIAFNRSGGDGIIFRHTNYPTVDRRTGIGADDGFLLIHGGSGGILFKRWNSTAILMEMSDAGRLTVGADPLAAFDVATKQYVDARVPPAFTAADIGKVLAIGTGPLMAWTTPTGGGGGIPDAPIDGQTYGRKDAAWAVVSGAAAAVGPNRTFRVLAGGTTVLDASAEVHFASAISNATLPLASSCAGRIYEFYAANQINIGRSGSDTIVIGTAAGVTSYALPTGNRLTLVSDGVSKWVGLAADPALSITGITAGGSLSGTYPNPGIGANMVGATHLQSAAVQPNKMAGMTAVAGDVGKIVVLDHTNPTTQWKISSAVLASDGALTLAQTAASTPGLTYSTGSSPIKLRIGCVTAGNYSFYTNAAFNNVKDDAGQPSLAWVFDAIAKEFGFYGAPPGGTAVWAQMMALTAAGCILPTAGNAFIAGSNTAKARLHGGSSFPTATLSVNRTPTNTQDDPAKPSWFLNLDAQADVLQVTRCAAGDTSSQIIAMTLTAAGMAVPSVNATVTLGDTTLKSRAWHNSANGNLYISTNYTGGVAPTQDVPGQASWVLNLPQGLVGTNDSFRVRRAPPGSVTLADLLTVDNAGNLTAGQYLRLAGRHHLNFPGSGAAALCCNNSDALTYDNTKHSWQMQLDHISDIWRLYRAPNSAPTSWVALATVDNVGSLLIAGPVGQKSTGTTWSNPSDRRLKDEIEDYHTGLDAVLQLQPRTFVYNGKGGSTAGLRGWGFIADEVAPIVPEMVGSYSRTLDEEDEEPTDIQTLDTSNLVLLLVNAVQELAARVAALEAN